MCRKWVVQSQDDAELAGPLDASGSMVSVLKSALLSSCRIACAQSNNINSSNRTSYATMGSCRIGALWDAEEDAELAGALDASLPNLKVTIRGAGVMHVQERDDAELAGPLDASGSTVSVHQSALVSSCRIPCAQSSNINSSNRTVYDDAELAGSADVSGSMVSVLESALVSSCRIACVQSSNINISNRIAYVLFGTSGLIDMWFGVLWRLASVFAFRRLWQDDAELAGALDASGSVVPVRESALVSSCRIACAQSNNINSSNRIAYGSLRLGDCGRTMLSWQVLWTPVAVRFLCFNLRCRRRVLLHVLKATMSIAAIEWLMQWVVQGKCGLGVEADKQPMCCRLCADGAHSLMRSALAILRKTMLSWQVIWTSVAVRFLCFNPRYCRCIVLHVLKATISITAIEPLMLYADGGHLLIRSALAIGSVRLADCGRTMLRLAGCLDASVMSEAEGYNWKIERHPCSGEPRHVRIAVVV
ncbi:hypothetical protein cyc_00006 [Cyclospora cayetanensis]|uniref:Uncharacterized protein n=1 Tax=Cyclospora cayetanensis TaxID=88456 RepID=A0A1D3CXI1_9EIME|nr:hypothetical protein cyc_00006 [Cyclospora cayetanensis]